MSYTDLYGKNIEPNWEYCANNSTPEQSPTCSVKCTIDEKGNCKKFNYDPLMRTPRNKPPLGNFSKEDFKL